MGIKKKSRTTHRRLGSVASFVEFRAKLQGTSSEALQVVRGSLRDDVRPLSDSSPADTEGARNVHRLFEMSDDINFVHGDMLTIVPLSKQPCSTVNKLTLVDMRDWKECKDLADRLRWAQEHSHVSRADLAEACGISTAAVGKWLNNETTDIKLDNFFAIASLMMVNPRWLGTGNDTPFTGIPSIYKDIPGAYLKVAKDLAEVGDKRLNSTVGELIAAKRSTGGKKPQRKKGEAIRAS